MTLTTNPPVTAPPPEPPRSRRRLAALVTAAVLAAGGLGAGLAASLGGSATPSGLSRSSAYAYYQQVMGRFGFGSMMGGSSYGWMMGPSGYAWMMGDADSQAWMRGSSMPESMMGGSTDPGAVMGQLFADAPGPRVSPAQAAALGDQLPAGAAVDRAANRLTFSGQSVSLAVEASPSMPAENFRIADMVNPTVVVSAGAKVMIELINADTDMAHGVVVTSGGAASSFMPMMTAAPAFPGAALWFLGEANSAGMHSGTLSFAANQQGIYQYLCPVPGHAQEGMAGAFIVS